MRWTFLLVLLLCSCATQRNAEKYFDEHTAKLAEYVDKNEAYTQAYGGAYAAKYFPPRFLPPAIQTPVAIAPERLIPGLMLERWPAESLARSEVKCPVCRESYVVKTVYYEDTVRLESMRLELKKEHKAHDEMRRKLKKTEAERDYWQEMNRKKFWTLIAMAVFALLYLLFKVLAARVRET